MKIIQADLFTSKEKYLCHQCNCVTKKAAHLAKDVFTYFPYANVYSTRINPDKPGEIIIRGDGVDQRYVVALLGQYYPGKPSFPNSKSDGYNARKEYFHRALIKLSQIENLQSVAFPVGIGCGAAGGDWNSYLDLITRFAKYIKTQQNADVVLYQK